MQKKIKVGRLFRSEVGMIKANAEDGTTRMSFSSDAPYERFFGFEVLDHSEAAVDMGRLLNKAPVLAEHDTTKQIGVVESAQIVGSKGFVDFRWGNSALAQEYKADVEDGIRSHVSVGYIVHEMELQEKAQEGPDTFLVKKWEPLEVSFVSVAADDMVGIGRSDDADKWDRELSYDDGEPEPIVPEVKEPIVADKTPEVAVVVDNAPIEKQRQSDIRNTAKMIHDLPAARDLADQFCDNGKSVGEYLEAVKGLRGASDPIMASPEIGLSNKEIKGYSWIRAINALANPNDRGAQEAAAYEREVSEAADQKMGTKAQGLRVPYDVLSARASDMVVGTPGDGGYLKGTDHLGSSFIELLRNKMLSFQLGVGQLTGLVGDVAIPKQTAGASSYWVAEDGTVTNSNMTTGQVTLSPKTVGALTEISRKLLAQSDPSANALVQNDVVAALALGIDLAVFHGSGASNQPVGIAPLVSNVVTPATSGVNNIVGSATGATLANSHLIDMETQVSIDNADVASMAYVINSGTRGFLRQLYPNTTGGDTPVYGNGSDGMGIINGYRAAVTNQIVSTADKSTSTGVCNAVVFGDFSQALVGMWGSLDLLLDPYTNSATGALRIVAMQDVDVAIRQAGAFAVMGDALLT